MDRKRNSETQEPLEQPHFGLRKPEGLVADARETQLYSLNSSGLVFGDVPKVFHRRRNLGERITYDQDLLLGPLQLRLGC